MKKKTFYIIREKNDRFSVTEKPTIKSVAKFINAHYPKSFLVTRYIVTKSYNHIKVNHIRKSFEFNPI
jgi:hypothetical protein